MDMSDLESSRRKHQCSNLKSGASKLRVIIVEDSAIIRARLSESLAEIPNIEVVGQVETEAAALRPCDRRWDAAVLDLQLKQGRGSGVLKALAQGARPPNTKIIVFTNYAFPQYRDRSLSLGADLLLRQGARVPSRARSTA